MANRTTKARSKPESKGQGPWARVKAVLPAHTEGGSARFLEIGAVWENDRGSLTGTIDRVPLEAFGRGLRIILDRGQQ